MAIALQTLIFNPPRRVRLIFTGPLVTGAFQSTSYYAVTSTDGAGANPTNVVEAFAVANSPNVVELALDEDLAGGGMYEIDCTNVPVSSGPAFTGSLSARVGLPLAAPIDVEPAQSDLDLLLYNRDLLHDGNDFVLDPSGDLSTIAGRDNYIGAMNRRMVSGGLLWDPNYGARAFEFVNAPDAYRQTLAGNLLAQARADDRTLQATIDVEQDPTDYNSWDFVLTVQGRDKRDPFTISIPPSS